MINSNNPPYLRKKISPTLLLPLLSAAAIALLLLASPLVLSNFLLQPVQAQTPVSFRTTTESALGTLCTGPKDGAAISFAAQGTFSDPQHARITSGTFQVTNSSGGQILYSGSINGGTFENGTGGGVLTIVGEPNRFPDALHVCTALDDFLEIDTLCSTSDGNGIDVSGTTVDMFGNFHGAVECSSSQGGGGEGGNTTTRDTTTTPQQQPSSSSPSTTTGTTAQDSNSKDGDSDSDGIPDSSDKCPHNSNHRCYKEGGDTGTTTTTTTSPNQQQPSSSSSNRNGNQTR